MRTTKIYPLISYNNDIHGIISPEVWRLRNMYSNIFQDLLPCIKKLQQLGKKGTFYQLFYRFPSQSLPQKQICLE